MNTLVATPFSLARNALIVAQVTASNVIGSGSPSENTSGVTILTVPDSPTSAPARGSLTNKNQIEVSYPFSSTLNGGSTVTSLNLWWNRGASDNTWESLTGYNPTSLTSDYLVTGLTPGENYQFKYRAANIYGWGGFSPISTIPASKEPNTPSAPSTAISGTSVGISWALPDNQGSSITGYNVQILAGDDTTYVLESTYCPSNNSTVISLRYCEVPISILLSTKYNLTQGDLVVAEVAATNAINTSGYSPPNTVGALIEVIPSKPSAITRGALTSDTQVQLVITPLTGTATGGAPIITYIIQTNGGGSSTTFTTIFGSVSSPALSTTYLYTIPGSLNNPYLFRCK